MFRKAIPVWEKGKETEMNWFLRFTAQVPREGTIRIAAGSAYRVFVDGGFLCAGPARAAHGFSRVDEVPYRCEGQGMCAIAVEAGSYCCNSFEYLDEPGFLQCEVESGGEIAAATGCFGFTAERMTEKKQRVERYSFQRAFCEEYDLTAERGQAIEPAAQPQRNLLPRGVPLGTYPIVRAGEPIRRGGVRREAGRPSPDYRYLHPSGSFRCFPAEQLESRLLEDACALVYSAEAQPGGAFALYDMGRDVTGFIETAVTVKEETELLLLFDEILTDGDVDITRMDTTNAVRWRLPAGARTLLTFEPYTFRYLKAVCLGGACEVESVLVREAVCGAKLHKTAQSDPVLAKIYDAAVESFRQNAVDVFMDCPSRERAGWLCDSFFTARTEYALTGKSEIERCFLENYLLPERFPHIPEGMVPMCYPADHTDGVFIPNWAMWLVLELAEYLERSGDRELVGRFRPRVYGLIRYFDRFLNGDGLLEKLESWVFVEWSKANDLVQDVNYPSNMLYAKMLDCAGALYGDEALRERSRAMQETIRAQSFDGAFFRDHAVRRDGRLSVEPERTETCQYYAFFCGTARREDGRFAGLWRTLTEDFGPQRRQTGAHPDVFFSNAFIGNYLRLELLYRAGLFDSLRREIAGYFASMAERTGTLWEHDSPTASCCHGFASHVVCWLDGMASGT